MTRVSFNRGWSIAPRTSVFEQIRSPGERMPVTLPHDALIGHARLPEGHGRTAYYPESLAVEYIKTFTAPEQWRRRRVALEFQGVYRDAMVFVNDEYIAQQKGGYTTFFAELNDYLQYGATNTVRVEARAYRDSRWYSGVGIIRDVALIISGAVHIERTGPVTRVPDVDDRCAVVEVRVPVVSAAEGTTTVTVGVEIRDGSGSVIVDDSAPMTIRPGETHASRHRLYLPSPHRWSVHDPYLYSTTVTIREVDEELDRVTVPLGIRTLRLDPWRGLRINDEVVKLRGACIHHDNGVIGAATIGRAEERRVELLKAAGFNAIRSAHNPISTAMLEACDRLGMLVIDEAFDVWTEGKTAFDYSLDFPGWWERDLAAMVRKDVNHPSVIMYSIGNENVETGSGIGSTWGRRLAEKIRELDGARFITNGVNPVVSLIRDVSGALRRAADDDASLPAGGVNEFMDHAESATSMIVASSAATERTAESFAVLDVAGLNYGDSRYELDRELFPNRIIVGTETAPRQIDKNWRLVEEDPRLLGDFTWTGYDYLGEVGIGRARFTDDSETGFQAPFPWVTAWCGDIDITGHRRPQSFYREIVFGLRQEPYMAVERPSSRGRALEPGQWSWFDGIASWTWDVPSGTPLTVEVYSADDEVELLVNGRPVGRRPAGRENRFRARFDVKYEPGVLTAIGYADGKERGRHSLPTAARDIRLSVTPDRTQLTATDSELSFLALELVDGNSVLAANADRTVRVDVSGAGILQGLGSARPNPDASENFTSTACLTFDGRALAVVRPTGPGTITVTVDADGLAPQTAVLVVDRSTSEPSREL
jgi:beta-galactosidase